MRNNLYCPFTHSPSLDTETRQTDGFIETPLIVSFYTGAALRRSSETSFLEPSPLSLSLCLWTAGVTAGLGVISLTTFVSLCPFSTYLKLSAAAAQSLQTPTGGSQVCILAMQLSARQSGVTVNGNFSHNPPRQGHVCVV